MAGEAERIFDKAAADALLPRLRELMARLQDVASSDATVAGRRHLARAGQSNGSPEAAAGAFEAATAIQSVLEEIEGLGVLLRDPNIGLFDFPAERSGRPVYLCWRLGEEAVGWWHPRDTGIAGREPL
jgi:hypothetical protein